MKPLTPETPFVASRPGEASSFTRLLPRLRHPRGRFDLHAISRPARVFTGDFYVAHADRFGLRVVVGDVAGKGLVAAVVMAMIQEELERWVRVCEPTRTGPEATLFRLQDLLQPLLPGNRFATAVVAHLGRNGALEIASAGHCPPLIARAGGDVQAIAPTGPVLGILNQPLWTSVRTRLDSEEAILLYSDGLAETRSPEGVYFGESRLASVFTGLAGESGAVSRDIAEGLLGEAHRHSEGRLEDDLTLVVVRRGSGGS